MEGTTLFCTNVPRPRGHPNVPPRPTDGMCAVKPSVYVETTVVSYLASRPSRDLVIAAHQEITREWWEARRSDFDLFVSEILVEEVSAGEGSRGRRGADVAS